MRKNISRLKLPRKKERFRLNSKNGRSYKKRVYTRKKKGCQLKAMSGPGSGSICFKVGVKVRLDTNFLKLILSTK